MDELLGKLKVGGKARLKGRARKEGWDQVRDLRGEYRRREQKCVTEIVKGSKARTPPLLPKTFYWASLANGCN